MHKHNWVVFILLHDASNASKDFFRQRSCHHGGWVSCKSGYDVGGSGTGVDDFFQLLSGILM
ncbi:MAG: hypothetical protein LBE93_03570 [Enterobacter asburiae]|nr:hypothetical protein [Enterobacter asburiae]